MSIGSRRPLVVWLVASSLVFAGTAGADRRQQRRDRERENRAERMRSRGMSHFADAEYRLAAQQLMGAYRLDGRDETLFQWAEAVRATDDCELAVRLYERVGTKTNDMDLMWRAAQGMDACGQVAVVDADDDAPLVDRDDRLEAVPVSDDDLAITHYLHASAPADRPPRRPDTWVVVLGGSGVLLASAGLAMYQSAAPGDLDGLNHGQRTAAESRADWKRVIGAGVGTVGVGLSVVAALRYRAVRSRRRVEVSPQLDGGGFAGVSVAGSF